MLLIGTLKLPKLWNKFGPLPGLVPPVMSYWVFPAGGACDRLTRVFSPEDVIGGGGAWACVAETRPGVELDRTNAVARAAAERREGFLGNACTERELMALA